MALVEAHEVNARILYWGIEGSGKRTSLHGVYRKLRPDHRGELREVPTRFDPSVSYTVLPIELGKVGGMHTRIEMVAVPGAREHAPTRKQLLDQVDGIVFVADCQPSRLEENLASLEELAKSLEDYALSIDEIPLVVQYTKRDLCDGFAVEDLHRRLGLRDASVFEANATEGTGLLETLSTISKLVVRNLREQSMSIPRPPLEQSSVAAAPAALPPSALPKEPVAPPPVTAPVAAPVAPPAPATQDAPAVVHEDPRETMENAILAEAELSASASAPNQGSDPAALLMDGSAWHHGAPDDLDAPLGARLTPSMTIVSVGEATRADEHSVRIPLVLGDEDGETSTLVLTVRLDPLIDEGAG